MSSYLNNIDESLKQMQSTLSDQMPKGAKGDKAQRAAAKRVRRLHNLVEGLQSRCHQLMDQGALEQDAREEMQQALEGGSGFKRLSDSERARLMNAISGDDQ